MIHPQPKPRPRLLDKRQKQDAIDKVDTAERAKVRARSGGQCEVKVDVLATEGVCVIYYRRCPRRCAPGNHHLIGGSGRRNKGRSILAAHRLDVCEKCHYEITNKVLVPTDGTQKECAATVRYERRR